MTAPPQDMRGRHYARPDTYVVNVRIEHPVSGAMINYGTFGKADGGEIDSGTKTIIRVGRSYRSPLPGPKTVSNLVVTRAYRLARDHDVIQQLIDSVGRSSTIVHRPATRRGRQCLRHADHLARHPQSRHPAVAGLAVRVGRAHLTRSRGRGLPFVMTADAPRRRYSEQPPCGGRFSSARCGLDLRPVAVHYSPGAHFAV